MERVVDADYLVVGAGASGMAFTDALVDYAAVRVAVLDRRHAPGGHWLDAYPFVRLHQASSFYGVASTLLGGGRLQSIGPEAGLAERAAMPEICAYYLHVMQERLVPSGKVEFYPGCEYLGDGTFASHVSGKRFTVRAGCRVVDASYLAPEVPSTTPAPFAAGPGVRVVPVGDLARARESAESYVVVGSGKTATDACVWLLENGVDPDRICWVRPRDPWMLNRAVVQPDPAVFADMGADVLEAASYAGSPQDLFQRLEDSGVMLRIDRSVLPTMAKTPTLAEWELEYLRSIEQVVRLGHVRRVESGRLTCQDGEAPLPRGALVVHCAAPGLQYPPRVPIWAPDRVTIQPIRAGFPCFGAALAGYVEATRSSDDEKNRLCPPTPLADTPDDWCAMQVLGARAVAGFTAEPDIRDWSNRVALNPARITEGDVSRPELSAALERAARFQERGLGTMAAFAGLD